MFQILLTFTKLERWEFLENEDTSKIIAWAFIRNLKQLGIPQSTTQFILKLFKKVSLQLSVFWVDQISVIPYKHLSFKCHKKADEKRFQRGEFDHHTKKHKKKIFSCNSNQTHVQQQKYQKKRDFHQTNYENQNWKIHLIPYFKFQSNMKRLFSPYEEKKFLKIKFIHQ